MSDINIYITIFLMSISTYAIRFLPFAILSGKKIGDRWVKFLSFIPITVMSSLLVPELLFRKIAGESTLFISFENLSLIAAIFTFIIGYQIKNFFIIMLSGMGFLALLRYLFN